MDCSAQGWDKHSYVSRYMVTTAICHSIFEEDNEMASVQWQSKQGGSLWIGCSVTTKPSRGWQITYVFSQGGGSRYYPSPWVV